MNTYKLRGKLITLTTSGVPELLSVAAPDLFFDYDTTKFNSSFGIVQLYIESTSPFSIKLQDETDGTWTDSYTPTSNVFSLSNICVNDIELTPTVDGQTVYVFTSGN